MSFWCQNRCWLNGNTCANTKLYIIHKYSLYMYRKRERKQRDIE